MVVWGYDFDCAFNCMYSECVIENNTINGTTQICTIDLFDRMTKCIGFSIPIHDL